MLFLEAFFCGKIFLTNCWHGGTYLHRGPGGEGVQPHFKSGVVFLQLNAYIYTDYNAQESKRTGKYGTDNDALIMPFPGNTKMKKRVIICDPCL